MQQEPWDYDRNSEQKFNGITDRGCQSTFLKLPSRWSGPGAQIYHRQPLFVVMLSSLFICACTWSTKDQLPFVLYITMQHLFNISKFTSWNCFDSNCLQTRFLFCLHSIRINMVLKFCVTLIHRLQLSRNLRDSPGFLAIVPDTGRHYCKCIVGPNEVQTLA